MDPLQFTLSVTGIIISGLTGGLAGAAINHWLTISRDRRQRLHAFRSFLRSVLFELQAIDLKSLHQGQLFQRHQATVQAIRPECARVLEDVSCRRRTNFEDTWLAYCGLRQQDVEPYDHYDPQTSREAILFLNYARGFERVRCLLNEMIDHAKYQWRFARLAALTLSLLLLAANLHSREDGHSSIYEHRSYGWPFKWLGVAYPHPSGIAPVRFSIHLWPLGGELLSLVVVAGAYGLARFSGTGKPREHRMPIEDAAS